MCEPLRISHANTDPRYTILEAAQQIIDPRLTLLQLNELVDSKLLDDLAEVIFTNPHFLKTVNEDRRNNFRRALWLPPLPKQ